MAIVRNGETRTPQAVKEAICQILSLVMCRIAGLMDPALLKQLLVM